MMNGQNFQRQPVEMPAWRVHLSTSVSPVVKIKICLPLQSACSSITFDLVVAICMIANASFAIFLLEQISSYQPAKSLLINDPSVRSVNMQKQGDNVCVERKWWWTRELRRISQGHPPLSRSSCLGRSF